MVCDDGMDAKVSRPLSHKTPIQGKFMIGIYQHILRNEHLSIVEDI